MDRSRAVFERWDLNGDGVLDFTEVVAGCLGTGMEPEEVSAMFEQMDVNGDGEISLDEWLSGAAVYKANAYAAVVPTPGSSRLTTGVTLAFFKDLPSIFLKLKGGGVKKLPNVLEQDITTEQLVFGQSARNTTGPGPTEWCIAGATEKGRCCFIELCELAGLTAAANGSPYFAPVTHFVSHTWGANFPQLVTTLELYAAGDNKTSFFLDVFAINQHVPPWRESPPKTYDEALGASIAVCRRTVLVLQPWVKPTSLTRAWCLFEITTTLDVGGTLDVALSQADRELFVETLTENFSDIMQNLSDIDASKATATVLEDRDTILKLIESKNGKGFRAVNEAVMGAIRAWLVEAASAALTGLEESAGAASTEVANLMHSIGTLYTSIGRYKDALDAFGRVLEVRRQVLGEQHPETADTMYNMANAYEQQEQYEPAAASYDLAGDAYAVVYGVVHDETLDARKLAAAMREKLAI